MAMTLITTNTLSSSASSAFTSNLDSTYKLYILKLINVHPASESYLTFQGSIDGGSNYNVTMTTTHHSASHQEDDSATQLVYHTGKDQAQGTAYQTLTPDVDNDNDSSMNGTIWLFNPSNTTYVKHFYSRITVMWNEPGAYDAFTAGYFNTTDNIDALSFKMNSGNLDAGVIKMYGVG
jgi:hypothetical protein